MLWVFVPDRLYSSGLRVSLRFNVLNYKENHFHDVSFLILYLKLKQLGHEYEFVEVKDRTHDFGLFSINLAYKVYPCPSIFLAVI